MIPPFGCSWLTWRILTKAPILVAPLMRNFDDFLADVVASNDLHGRSDPPWTSLDATSRPALTVATGSQHPPGRSALFTSLRRPS